MAPSSPPRRRALLHLNTGVAVSQYHLRHPATQPAAAPFCCSRSCSSVEASHRRHAAPPRLGFPEHQSAASLPYGRHPSRVACRRSCHVRPFKAAAPRRSLPRPSVFRCIGRCYDNLRCFCTRRRSAKSQLASTTTCCTR